jgi:hypothetical protein
MIALDDDGSIGHQFTDNVNHPAGISPITDEIAKKSKLLGTAGSCMGHAGLKGFTIGVNVSEKSYPHGYPSMFHLLAM